MDEFWSHLGAILTLFWLPGYPGGIPVRSRGSREGPRGAQEAPKTAQEAPKTPQEKPKTTQEAPKTNQEAPRSDFWAVLGPAWPVLGASGLSDGSQRAHNARTTRARWGGWSPPEVPGEGDKGGINTPLG